jgi:uncharacterized protein (TIGR04141 family)
MPSSSALFSFVGTANLGVGALRALDFRQTGGRNLKMRSRRRLMADTVVTPETRRVLTPVWELDSSPHVGEGIGVARQRRLERLTWSLLKAEYARKDILVAEAEVSAHVVPALTTQTPSLFIKATPPHPPGWLSYLEPHVRGGLTNLFAASSGAVLVLEAAGRVFAITLGQGRHLLNTSAFESDFGLKVVLNTVMPDQLKSVDAKTVEENTLHTRREVSRNSSISAFGLDVTRDLLRAVTGKPQDESLGPWLTGSDTLGIQTRLDVPELPGLAEQLLAAYESDAYKKEFEFIDFLRPEKSPARKQELEELLVDVLRRREISDLHLAAPEPLDWSDMNGFRFSTQASGAATDSDPRISRYLATKDDAELTMADLKRDKMLAISASTTYAQNTWPIFQCIVYEVELDGQLYVLSGGDWFRVNLDFKERVLEELGILTTLMEGLPQADAQTTEAAYNAKAATSLNALCLDTKLVRDGGPDSIEICDILTREGGFIHVKHRGSSATLSHLFAQGINSAERFLQDAGFREKAREIAAAENPEFAALFSEGRPDAADHEITFAVITRSSRDTLLTLPFFSIVSLRAAALRLRAMGFRVSVASVRELTEAA